MKEKMEKNDEKNSLFAWYKELPRTKKSKFLITLQLKLEISQGAIYYKMKNNNWRSIERDIIEQVINEGSWEA